MGLQNPVLVGGKFAGLPAIVPISVDVNGFVNVNATFSGTISGNAAAGPTGSTVPSNADYIGLNIAGILTGLSGVSLTNANAATVAVVDGSGNQITSFGGGAQFADNAASGATPTGTLSMGWDSANSKIRALKVDATQSLLVSISNFPATQPVSGTVSVTGFANPLPVTGTFFQATQPVSIAAAVTVTQSTAANLNATVIFGSPQHVIIDSATLGTVVISGTVTANAGSNLNTSALSLDTSTQAPLVVGGGITAPSKVQMVGGKTNDGTPQYDIMPLGAGGRSLIVEGFVGGTAVPVSGTFFQATQPVSIAANVGVTQQTSPWVTNQTQSAGVALGSTAVVNYGSTPAATAVQAVNAFITNTVATTLASTTITGTVTVSGTITIGNATLAVTQSTSPWVVSGTVTANQGGAPWSVTFPSAQAVTLTSTTITGTAAVTQSTSPWVENVSQFGGNNVVTGTGISGVGIPRVTVSSDSFPATQVISAVSLPLPLNAAQETGGNLDAISNKNTLIIQLLELQREQLAVLKAIQLQDAVVYGNIVDSNQFIDGTSIL